MYVTACSEVILQYLQPWYAKKGSTLPAEEPESKIGQKSLPASDTQLHTLSLPAPGDENCTNREGRRDRKKEKRKKEEKKEQRRKEKKGKELQLDALRRERREREAAEKLRQRQVIMGGRAGYACFCSVREKAVCPLAACFAVLAPKEMVWLPHQSLPKCCEFRCMAFGSMLDVNTSPATIE